MQAAMDANLDKLARNYKRKHKRELGSNIEIADVQDWGKGIFVKKNAKPIEKGETIAGYGGIYTPCTPVTNPQSMSHAVTLAHNVAFCDGKHYNGPIAHAASKANTADGKGKNNAKLHTHYGITNCISMKATKRITPGEQVLCAYKIYPDGENARMECKETKTRIVNGHKKLKLQRIWAHDYGGKEPCIVVHTCTHGNNKEETCTCASKHHAKPKWIKIRKAAARTQTDPGEGCFVHVPTLLAWNNNGKDDIIVLSACNTNYIAKRHGTSGLCKHYNITTTLNTHIAPRIKAHMPALFYANELQPQTTSSPVTRDTIAIQGILKAHLEHVDDVPCLKVTKRNAIHYINTAKREWAEIRFAYDTVTPTFNGKLMHTNIVQKAEIQRRPRAGKRIPRRLKRKRAFADTQIDYIDYNGKPQTLYRAITQKQNFHIKTGLFLSCNAGATLRHGRDVIGKSFKDVTRNQKHGVVAGFAGDTLCAYTHTQTPPPNFICQAAFATKRSVDMQAWRS